MRPTLLARKLQKLPSQIYKPLARRYIDYEFPRHIFIETTAKCNLSCTYCPREKNDSHMDWELFKRIIRECDLFGPRSFSLHLFGEPLLYPHAIEAISYIKELNPKHTVILTTNGTYLNKFASKLLASGVDRIIWSWRKNNFNTESLKLLKKVGLIRILIEETPEEEQKKWLQFPAEKEVKHLHNYGGHIDVTNFGLSPSTDDSRYPCYHLFLAPAIRWNGDITICCNDPYGRECIGNYSRGMSLYEAWHSDKIKTLREGHIQEKYEGICKNCDVWKTYKSFF